MQIQETTGTIAQPCQPYEKNRNKSCAYDSLLSK